MKIVTTILSVISMVMLFSTFTCGLYIHFAKDKLEDVQGSINFHITIGVVTFIVCMITLTMFFFRK